MTIEEILDGYEDLWRQADREEAPHWRGGREHSQVGICAVLAAVSPDKRFLAKAAFAVLGGWACECRFFDDTHGLWAAMIHLNDDESHRWSFARFAKEFRSAYRIGQERWLNGIAIEGVS